MSIWGRLARRFEKEQAVRRLLAIDGGGIGGVLALEILPRGGSLRVPSDVDAFRRGSVVDRPGDWGELFDRRGCTRRRWDGSRSRDIESGSARTD